MAMEREEYRAKVMVLASKFAGIVNAQGLRVQVGQDKSELDREDGGIFKILVLQNNGIPFPVQTFKVWNSEEGVMWSEN